MGFTLPTQPSQADHARLLMDHKTNIEAQIEAQISILKANSSTMQTSLMDEDGFPRADIDVYAVRFARVRIIELRNDYQRVMDDIAKALQGIYDPGIVRDESGKAEGSSSISADSGVLKPFARVDKVAPGSPAAEAGLTREDLVVKFGHLDHAAFSSSLQPLSELVAESENRNITIRILRAEQIVFLTLTPRKGWGGRGMLGCHIVPHS